MIGNTHSDMKETFSHRRARRHLAWSHPPFNSEDLLVVAPLNLLIIIFPITLSSQQQRTTAKGEMRRRWRDRGGKVSFTYLLETEIASHYCVLQIVFGSKKGGKNREGMSWLLSYQGCSLCVATCQHRRPSAVSNLVTQTHNHTFTHQKTHSSAYTSNGNKAPIQTD